MTKKLLILFVLLFAVVLAAVGLLYSLSTDLGEKVVSIYIQPGDNFQTVSNTLADSGVVSSRMIMRLAARWRGVDRKLTPGRYDFTGKNSCRSLLDKLARAEFARIRVTVYEGAPIWKVASILAGKMEIDSAAVIARATDSVFLSSLGVPSLEGYLFPDTYFWSWGTGIDQLLSEMVQVHKARTSNLWTGSLPNGLTQHQVVILASIVEAEARLNDEKPVIASVYLNRLSKRMRLDADPTVAYGLGGLSRPLTRTDIRTPTPYNTYTKYGLPPSPINSPGLAAIKAVLEPAHTEYLFFVADGTGRHRFSRTNAEHNRARWEIRRSLRSSGG